MDNARPAVPIETLLAERDWVRWLARTLVADAQSADDLEQQTWLAAIERPPSSGGSVRGWLATVLRRAASKGRRSAERGGRRERAAARPEGGRSTVDIVAEAELHDRVVRAVLALEEPYRTTILLRFFENLPPRDVAERMGVPVETARSRVQRGVALLREQFDREHGGDRKAWIAAFVPLTISPTDAGPSPAPAAPDVPHAAVAFPVKALALGVAVMLAVGGAVRWYVGTTDERPDGPPTAPSTLVADGAVPNAPALAAPPAAEGGGAGTRSPARTGTLVGRVVRDGPDGPAVSGARVLALRRRMSVDEPPWLETTSGSDGRYAFAKFPAGEVMVVAYASGLATRGLADASFEGYNPLATTIVTGRSSSLDLVLVAGAVIEGRLVESAWKPVAGATIRATFTRLPLVLGANREAGLPAWSATSSDDGTFRFDALPSDAIYDFEAVAEGRHAGRRDGVEVPGADAKSLEIVIPASRWIDVQVVDDATGAPVPGARVFVVETGAVRAPCGCRPSDAWITGLDGHVRAGPVLLGAVEVHASADGYGQAVPVASFGGEGAPESALVVRIGRKTEPNEYERMMAFAGANGLKARVLDPDGRPVALASGASYNWTPQGGGFVGCGVRDGFLDGGYSNRPFDFLEVYDARDADGAPLPLGALRVTLAKNAHDLTIRLVPERTIEGRVVDPDGVGVGGALVVARPDWVPTYPSPLNHIVHATARADSLGAFRLGGLADATYRLTLFVPKNFASEATTVVAAGSTGVVLTPRSSIRPTITVVDSAGKPVPGVVIGLLPPGSDARDRARIESFARLPRLVPTDDRGVALLDRVDPGTSFLLTIEPPESRLDLMTDARVDWSPHDETLTLPIRRVLRGRVHDAAGRPVSDVEVLCTTPRGGGRSTTVAADGTFIVRDVPLGVVVLVPHYREQAATGRSASAKEFPAEADDVDLVFEPGLSLRVHVESAPPQLRGVGLRLEGVGAASARPVRPIDENPPRKDGLLRFRGLLPGRTYTLCVSPVDGLSLIREGVRSDAGELTVRLEPGLELTGHVLLPAGAIDVRVGCNDGRISAEAVVEADGRFTFTGLPAGSYDVTAWIVVGIERKSGRAEIRAGESGDIDLRRK